jgi:hypothetical protein
MFVELEAFNKVTKDFFDNRFVKVYGLLKSFAKGRTLT